MGNDTATWLQIFSRIEIPKIMQIGRFLKELFDKNTMGDVFLVRSVDRLTHYYHAGVIHMYADGQIK